MFKSTDLHRTLTAGVGALLISFTFIGAAVGPVGGTANASPVATVQASIA